MDNIALSPAPSKHGFVSSTHLLSYTQPEYYDPLLLQLKNVDDDWRIETITGTPKRGRSEPLDPSKFTRSCELSFLVADVFQGYYMRSHNEASRFFRKGRVITTVIFHNAAYTEFLDVCHLVYRGYG
jgi:hypothetical protein